MAVSVYVYHFNSTVSGVSSLSDRRALRASSQLLRLGAETAEAWDGFFFGFSTSSRKLPLNLPTLSLKPNCKDLHSVTSLACFFANISYI